jgi:RNA polymerase sigma-70 factor (ECF subfamily)
MSTTAAVFAGWIPVEPGNVLQPAKWMKPIEPKAQFDPAADSGADLSVEDAGAAVAALVDQYAGTLYRVAYSVLRNAADAEDAVQETYLRVLRHRQSLGEIRDARVWLVRIVWNVVLDRKRRAKSRPETDDIADVARLLPASGLTAEERVASAQHHEHVLRAVAQLPEKEQRVLILSAFEELTSVEIAQVLGTTESTIRSRLFRARKLLSPLLSQLPTKTQSQSGSAR